MVKLNIKENHLVIVLHQEFFTFYLDKIQLSWNFEQVVKCEKNVPKTDGSIECCSFSPCGKYFGICFSKNVIIYNTSDWSASHMCSGERKASNLQFFPTSKLILIADKSGCATFYSFKASRLQKTELALGHNSMLTCALISGDEKFVITSDRDEKIRVTKYPNVYNIVQYCLGHDMFVSYIGFLPTDKRILISCSGDGTVRFWDFIKGQQIALYDCNDGNINENSKKTITKFLTCEIDQMSIVAILEYKSKQIKIVNVKGDLNAGLKIQLIEVLTLKCIPWDVAFHDKILICILPDKNNSIVLWSWSDLREPKENFSNISLYIAEHWESFINTANKISDDVPVLFKKEMDSLQEYQQKKKARLLKTGKTS